MTVRRSGQRGDGCRDHVQEAGMTQNVLTPTPVVIFDEFLVAQELRNLLSYALARAPEFSETMVVAPDGQGYAHYDTRRSRVLFDLGPFHELFVDRIWVHYPHVMSRLGREPFQP